MKRESGLMLCPPRNNAATRNRRDRTLPPTRLIWNYNSVSRSTVKRIKARENLTKRKKCGEKKAGSKFRALIGLSVAFQNTVNTRQHFLSRKGGKNTCCCCFPCYSYKALLLSLFMFTFFPPPTDPDQVFARNLFIKICFKWGGSEISSTRVPAPG